MRCPKRLADIGVATVEHSQSERTRHRPIGLIQLSIVTFAGG